MYGHYTPVCGAKPVIITDATMEDDCTVSFEYEHVLPATVGQYTGLTDKKGTRIFEGDVVNYSGDIHRVVFECKNGTAYFGIVISEIETWHFCNSVPSDMMEVIGNIHDNPELMEE